MIPQQAPGRPGNSVRSSTAVADGMSAATCASARSPFSTSAHVRARCRKSSIFGNSLVHCGAVARRYSRCEWRDRGDPPLCSRARGQHRGRYRVGEGLRTVGCRGAAAHDDRGPAAFEDRGASGSRTCSSVSLRTVRHPTAAPTGRSTRRPRWWPPMRVGDPIPPVCAETKRVECLLGAILVAERASEQIRRLHLGTRLERGASKSLADDGLPEPERSHRRRPLCSGRVRSPASTRHNVMRNCSAGEPSQVASIASANASCTSRRRDDGMPSRRISPGRGCATVTTPDCPGGEATRPLRSNCATSSATPRLLRESTVSG